MPFYETYFMIHKKVTNKELRSLVVDCVGKMTTDGGCVLKVNDFGWRHCGQQVKKASLGKFHYGRWFHFFWAGKPTSVKVTHEVLRHNTSITRFISFKADKPSVLSDRDTFYLNPSVYKKNEEAQHPKVDYSV